MPRKGTKSKPDSYLAKYAPKPCPRCYTPMLKTAHGWECPHQARHVACQEPERSGLVDGSAA